MPKSRKRAVLWIAFAVAIVCPAFVATAGRAAPPPSATAQCRDGTYSFSLHHSGTCSHHGGVATWLGGTGTAPAPLHAGAATGIACGVERWNVKTLQDRPTLLAVQATTVAYLVSLPAPAQLPTTRLAFERHVFRVTAAVTLVRPEHDSDLHLVLRSGASHMIAEASAPGCAAGATPARRAQLARARAAVRLCARAIVTGVAFFDFDHGQTGAAPNAIELHPLLSFRCTTA